MAINQPIDQFNYNVDLDGNVEQHALDVIEVASILTDMKFDDKENEINKSQENQPNTSKKWYEGKVVRPVAFRSKRFNQN